MAPAWTRHAENVLNDFVDAQGRVDYESLRNDPRLTAAEADLAAGAAAADSRATDGLAYWINAYNLAALIVVARWAKRGNRIFRGGLSGVWMKFRFFFLERVRVAGRRRSLFGIEHRVLRKRFSDPRIHFALVCATESCPPLKDSLYDGDQIDQQLDWAARGFMRPGIGYTLDREERTIRANRIFRWYRRDFRPVGGARGAIIKWAPDHDASFARRNRLRVTYEAYDWALNQSKT